MKENGKLKSVLGNLDVWASVIVMLALLVLTFVGVLRRYIFRSPIAWMEEMQAMLFLSTIFLAAGAAFRTGGHVAIEIVVEALPKKVGRFIEMLDVPIQLVILAYLTMQSWTYFMEFVESGRVSIFLQIPYSIVYVILPVGCVLMIVSVLYAAYQKFLNKNHPAVEGGEEA